MAVLRGTWRTGVREPRRARACRWRALLAVTATFVVAASPAGAARYVDRPGGLAIDVPAGWHASATHLSSLSNPAQRLTLASFDVEQVRPDPGCFPRTAVAALPAGGALVTLLEYLAPTPTHLSRLPPRPQPFRLGKRQQVARSDGCWVGAQRRFVFRTGGRAFDLTVWLGADAPEPVGRAVERSLDSLAVAPQVVGRSPHGRAIRAVELGSPDASARVLVVGCIHGDECAAAAVLSRLRAGAPEPRFDLWVVPTLNPDGRALGTRQNARLVDLNRNFPTGWRPIGERGSRYWSGPRAASEPETRAAMRLIERLRPDLTIWYHQPERNVRSGGGSSALARRYAELADLPYRALPVPPGAATRWQHARYPGSQAFVVELPAGPLSDADASRHARAIRTLGAELERARAVERAAQG